MGFFDKVTKTAYSFGKSTLNSAVKVKASIETANQDQTELDALKAQITVIDQELDASYVQIGRKFVDYVMETGQMPGVDVSDILKLMDPKMTRKQELQQQVIELEKKMKDNAVLRERQLAEEEYLKEKEKLDKALGMEVLSQSEYDAKLAVARKKFDNFEEIRRVEKQYEMQLITYQEYCAKMQEMTQ